MDFVLIEEISLFKYLYEFKVYEYNDEINLNDKNSFVCNIRVFISKVNPIFSNKTNQKLKATILVENLNENYYKKLNSNQNIKIEFKEEIIENIYQEIEDIELEKENIEVLFTS